MLLCVGVSVSADDGSPFSDVKTSRWSYEAIQYAVNKGYMNGVGNGKFDPAGSMTRGMVVTVLYRREGSPAVKFRDDFTDVKAGKYYSDAVIWAKDEGIVNGITETTFEPNGKITREQLATMLARFSERCLVSVPERADLSGYPDADKIHSYAKDALAWANEANLIKGMSDGTLSPRGNATREQFATILKRFDDTFNLVYNDPVPKNQHTEREYPLVDDADVYVAVDGNDSADGTIDHPVATFDRAAELVRQKKTEKAGDVIVAFKAGDYGPLSLNLTAEDSGTADQRIIWCRYGDGEVVFNNGIDVLESEFTDLSDAEKSIFDPKYADSIKKADLSGRLASYDPRVTMILGDNGDCTLARFPNRYSDRTDQLIQSAGEAVDDSHYLIDHPLLTKRIDKYRTTEGLLLYGYLTTGWAKDLLSTDEYDPATGLFHIPHPEQSKAGHLRYLALDGFDSRFWAWTAVVNIPEELDDKGEYWIDPSTYVMYVFKPEGTYHITGGGRMLDMRHCDFFTFDGLTFKNSTGEFIYGEYCHDLAFDGCTFQGCAAENTVYFLRNDPGKNFNITVRNCEFSTFAAYGLQIHTKSAIEDRFYCGGKILIDNNLFTQSGLRNGNTAALSFNVGEAVVTHNLFKDCCWEGIDFRGAYNMRAEYNVFDRVCYNGDDTGAINNWGSVEKGGNLVTHNLFMHITGGGNGRYGLYLDATSGTSVISNLFYDCWVPVMNHDICKYNTYSDNVSISLDERPNPIACDTHAGEFTREMMEQDKPGEVLSHEFYVSWVKAFEFYDNRPELKARLAEEWPGYFDITTDIERWDEPEFCLNPSLVITGNREFSKSGDPVVYKDIVMKFSTVENNQGVPLTENPLFVNPTIGDYRIRDDVTDFPDIEFEKIGRY